MCVQWAWVLTQNAEDARKALYLAATGHLARHQLRARISPVNPASVDIEFAGMKSDEITQGLKSMPWVVDFGLIPEQDIPEDVPDPETIREQFGIHRTAA